VWYARDIFHEKIFYFFVSYKKLNI